MRAYVRAVHTAGVAEQPDRGRKKIITSEGRLTPCVWYLHAGKAVPSRAQRVPLCMIPTAAAVVRGCRDMQC